SSDVCSSDLLILRIQGHINPGSGALSYLFQSLDPETMSLTTDPDAGFLPPDANPPQGLGSIDFTVSPLPGLVTGNAIRNKASIVFDYNSPLVTPEYLNVIDKSAPS